MNERKHQHAILEQHVGQAVVFDQNGSHVLAVQNWVGSTGFWECLELLKGRFEGVIEVLSGIFARVGLQRFVLVRQSSIQPSR